ncbi:hypothetical protein [Desertivirga brevis]|uniref:hypothetical protein n=1 Tax=Desertivirga brevis TaxID=2810310 RepID=UPI001A9715FF|nr:hypothetical protein [Pedobacter sp. SYSU D00873]
MDFDELKKQWLELSADIDKQEKLTDSKIIEMTKQNYKNKFRAMKFSEFTGAGVCLAALLFVINGIEKLDSWYLITCGIISVLVLIVLPVISLISVFKMGSIDIPNKNYKQALSDHSMKKISLIRLQKMSFYLGAMLFVTIIPLLGKLMNDQDLFESATLWYLYALAAPFLYYFTRWVFNKYDKSLDRAEGILKELNR